MNEEIVKRMQTIMVGSIAAIEKRFGFLFGHGKDRSELTEEEIVLKKAFLKLRNDILDLGNKQISKTEEDFKKKNQVKYSYKWRVK